MYRGLGGLDISDFLAGNGFTERAFTSTTKNLDVALEYSGAAKGLAGTVLAIEMSEVDQGAVIKEFSQYPGEEEILWNACSYMEALKGKEELKLTEWGPVKVMHIKMNASGRAMTVEELEAQRKNIVVNMLETIRGDVGRFVSDASKARDFQKKAESQAGPMGSPGRLIKRFVDLAVAGSDEVVAKYKEQSASWFHPNDQFAEAVASAAELPELALSWVKHFIEDKDRKLMQTSWKFCEAKRDLRRFRQRQLEAARKARDATEIQRFAGALCSMKGYVKGPSSIDEPMIDGSHETPLIEKFLEGDIVAIRLLLEAKAEIQAKHGFKDGMTFLQWAVQDEWADAMKLLLEFRANTEAKADDGMAPLHRAAKKGHLSTVQALLEAKADTKAQNADLATPLLCAVKAGHAHMVRALVDAKSDVEAEDTLSQRPLFWAAALNQDADVTKVLLEANADPEARTRDGHQAVEFVHKDEVKRLFDQTS